MLDYLEDWEAFVKEKDAAAKTRRERRAEISAEVKPSPTEAQYVKHFYGWMLYCDTNLDGDYTVVAAPVLDYITREVLTDCAIKRIAPETSYKGIIGFKCSECTDPSLNQPTLAKEQGQEQIMDTDVDVNDLDGTMKSKYPASELSKSKWTSMEQPTEPKLDLIAWQIDKALIDAMSERLQPNTAYEIKQRCRTCRRWRRQTFHHPAATVSVQDEPE
ncbi:hypothetical protein BGZ96_011058 [Linnemannia gamsii]|uniref:Uncharacterized protein n=1 Tax=Linnemannia gamsii TaxID=64522 RepID=A0ABQ7JTN6_9FUNG|nr:hypothetical protein BGZ96_011058 [Linnemannia gamsii]